MRVLLLASLLTVSLFAREPLAQRISIWIRLSTAKRRGPMLEQASCTT